MPTTVDRHRGYSGIVRMPMLSRPIRIIALLAAALLGACGGTHPSIAPAPRTIPASAPELAIYRTVAESMYVRTTGKPVGIVVTSADTACVAGAVECPSLATRWGLDPMWWSADSTI